MTIEEDQTAFILAALTCPITLEVFVDPVLASDGYTYERAAIAEWIEHYDEKSPMTRQPIELKELKPNRIVKQLADQYRTSISTTSEKSLHLFSGRGTKDGFAADDFHRCCNQRGPTLTLIQARHRFHPKNRQSIFGGYSTIPWSSEHGYYRDPHSFLFVYEDDRVVRFNL